MTVQKWKEHGYLEEPQGKTIPLTGEYKEGFGPGGTTISFWSTSQIERMLERMSTAPILKSRIPGKSELAAFIKYDGMLLYAKNKTGDFVPIWEAEDW